MPRMTSETAPKSQRRALVTGGSGDLGGAICTALAAAGFQVIVHANRGIDRADRVVQQIIQAGGSAQAIAFDVADQAASQVLGGLPPDYLDASLAALREVTPESATAAYTSVVDAATASLVVVGAADQLAEPLRALGYDDLVVAEG